jgi:ABC-type xylose transport system substrate-binding protein
MLEVFHAEGKEIAIKILAKRPLCWHTGPCSAVNLADGIPDKFIQATQDLGIDSFFMPSLNADQLGYRGSVSRLHHLFKEAEKLVFGENHPHYWCTSFQRAPFSGILAACYQRLDLILSSRHMDMLMDQACKTEMTADMGSEVKTLLEDDDSGDDAGVGFRSRSVDTRY